MCIIRIITCQILTCSARVTLYLGVHVETLPDLITVSPDLSWSEMRLRFGTLASTDIYFREGLGVYLSLGSSSMPLLFITALEVIWTLRVHIFDSQLRLIIMCDLSLCVRRTVGFGHFGVSNAYDFVRGSSTLRVFRTDFTHTAIPEINLCPYRTDTRLVELCMYN